MIIVIISGLVLIGWIKKGLISSVGLWRAYSISVSTVVLGVTVWMLGEGLAGGIVITGLWVWLAMVIIVGGSSGRRKKVDTVSRSQDQER